MMVIEANAEEFMGKPVRDFEYGQRIEDPTKFVYRLRIPWEIYEEGFPQLKASPTVYDTKAPQGLMGTISQLFGIAPKSPAAPAEKIPPFLTLFQQFVSDPSAPNVPALIIGDWGGAGESNDSGIVVQALVEAADRLPNLQALFLGDIVCEEAEISWITQCDLSPLWAAYPNLEHVQIRGADHLELGRLALPKLHTLIIESGGLPASVLQEIWQADLPLLEHLELWLGDGGYGGDSTIDDLRPVLDGTLFPKLCYLGLRDSEIVDEIAKAVSTAPVLDRIRILDLSLGNLSDEGGEALLATPIIKTLERLDLHHHYLSDEVMKRFVELGIEVDLSEREEPDEDNGEVYRYIAVSE
ncbi:MAG: STM4015 family protein [Armatimonadota bacterium]